MAKGKPQEKPRPAASKEAGKKEAKRRPNAAGESRLYYIAGGVAVALVALLIGSAHMMKRARRARRRKLAAALAANETIEEEEAPSWVVSEETMLLTVVGLVAALAAASVFVAVGQRALASWRAKSAAASEREAAQAATARRKDALADAKAQLAVVRQQSVARNAEEREKQKAFEAKLIEQIREHERRVAEAKAAEAAIVKAETEAARLEAVRLDQIAQSKSFAPPSTAPRGSADWQEGEDEGWDVGDYEEAEDEGEAMQGGSSASAAAAADDDDEEDDDDDAIPAAADRLALERQPLARGTRVTLESLVMPEAATARATEMWVELSCSRCNTCVALSLGGLSADTATRKTWCEQCGALLSATLRPCLLVPPFSSVVGHVDASNCRVNDVPRLSVLMACGRCDAELPLPPLQRGRTVQAGCRSCHAPLSLKMNNVLVEPLGGGGLRTGAAAADDEDEMESLLKKLRKKNVDQFKQLGLIIGRPLPNKGACKHYGHSYRWLRFPCCGRAFPCAVCHEASDCPAAALGVWATRMLCGKCSREMPYADTPCTHCGNTFTRPGGAHWQGGAGCRDQQRLSNKDARKHKGSSMTGVKKTTSQKSQRVGAAGKKAAALKKVAHGA